ncbi:MAG: tetratricopeptide repeat protein [Deltaproteobacteria bacterium]|nr:tetratricopeptide repeat protein [Deltaproteobacteria bacterium]
MKKIILLAALLGMLGGTGTSGWCQYSDEEWYKNKNAEDFVRWGDRVSRYKVNWRKAIHAYQKALELDPGNVRAHMGLARVYMQRNEYLRAAEEYEKTLALAQSRDTELFEYDSDAMDFYIAAARLMIEALRQPDRAQPFLEMAKEIDSGDSWLKKLEKEARLLKESGPGAEEVGKDFARRHWRRERPLPGAPEIVKDYIVQLDVPEEREVADKVIRVLDKVRVRLELSFRFTPGNPIDLTILTRRHFEKQAKLFLAGSAIGSRDHIVIQTLGADMNNELFNNVLYYQYGRIWLRAYLGYDPPHWLSNGFGVLSQKIALSNSIHMPADAEEGYRMVKYLVEQSRDRFRRFLEDAKATRDLPLTLQNMYGLSEEELRRQGKR